MEEISDLAINLLAKPCSIVILERYTVSKGWKVLDVKAIVVEPLHHLVAVMTRALAEQESGGEAMVIVQQISSYLLLSCGILYIITGILCIRHLKQARLKRALNRDQAAKDLEELDKRRKELQRLLS